MKSPWKFKNCGQSGLPISDLFPNIRECADDLCVVRSMVGEGVDHGAALLQTFTGTFTFTRPSMGSWVLYGLGSHPREPPRLYHHQARALARRFEKLGVRLSAWLGAGHGDRPPGHAGERDPEKTLSSIWSTRDSREQQRYELDMIQAINRKHQELWKQVTTNWRLASKSYEMGFRMQAEASRVFDVTGEPEATRKLYGLDEPKTADFGWQCLLARRLAEADVRFIQCTHSYKWDQHSDLFEKHNENAAEVDKPIAGLLKDLKARGLLQDTLVIWSGEFGRTPVSEGGPPATTTRTATLCFCAGGGVKPGFAYGATDDFGYHAAENRMHIHDFHATVLALGLDHLKLTYRYSGRDFRLTDTAGNVHDGVFA